jgi:hypothetical protein
MGWAFASPDGKPGIETARDLLSQLCEYTLHLDAFEQKLDEISAADAPRPRSRAPGNTATSRSWQR